MAVKLEIAKAFVTINGSFIWENLKLGNAVCHAKIGKKKGIEF